MNGKGELLQMGPYTPHALEIFLKFRVSRMDRMLFVTTELIFTKNNNPLLFFLTFIFMCMGILYVSAPFVWDWCCVSPCRDWEGRPSLSQVLYL